MAVRVFANGGVLSSLNSAFSYNGQSPSTFMAWLYANDATVWQQRTSMAGVYGPANPTTAMQLGCIDAGNFGVWTWGGSLLVGLTGHSPVGQWNHYTVTYDGAGNYSLYINTILVSTNTVTQQAGNFSQIFINGYPTGNSSESGNFCVDDIILFNRQLSLNEIRTIYTVEGPRDGIAAGVLCRYTYDEGVMGAAVSTGWDLSATRANMTPSPRTSPIYFTPRAMTNVRRVQG